MTTLWLVYQQNNQHNQQKISRELRSEGYDVKPVDIASIDFTPSGTPDADLVIVHLHPDVQATWGLISTSSTATPISRSWSICAIKP